jgi:MFS family permease
MIDQNDCNQQHFALDSIIKGAHDRRMTNQATTMDPEAAPARRFGALPHNTGFWIIAAAFLIVIAYAAVPTPLYAIYRARDGFSAFTITVIFGAYAAGVMLSLYLAGHVSDWLGRRRVILAAIIIELASAVLFLTWTPVSGLLIARFVSGVGVGMLTATATAHLSELRLAANPDSDHRASSIVATLVNIGGIGVGPLVGGILAEWFPRPLVTPYVVFAFLLAAAAIAVAFVPETVERQAERPAYRPQRVGLPDSARGQFLSAAALALSAFALFGIFTSLAPSFVGGTFHETSRFVAGLVVFAVFGAAAVAQVLTSTMPARTQLRLAAALMTVGQLGLAASVLNTNLPGFFAAGIVAGAGGGIAFRSALGLAASLATPSRRGEVLAVIFLIGYAGMAIPVILVGIALGSFSATSVFVTFSVIVLVLVDWSSLSMARRTPVPPTVAS